MRFALVNGQRQEAQPTLSGECPGCGRPMVAKCGEVRIRHWAHKGNRLCDPWWENETEWHRTWKDQFPADWQEIVHDAGEGERHIADVKTAADWVIEFQHYPITLEERRFREGFYPKLIWVVDGTRRKRDREQFKNARQDAILVGQTALVCKAFSHDCALLREWVAGTVPMLFDFGDEALWWLLATSANGLAYLHRFSRTQFIEWHRTPAAATDRPFDAFVNDILPKLIGEYESHLRRRRWVLFQPRELRRSFRL